MLNSKRMRKEVRAVCVCVNKYDNKYTESLINNVGLFF